jgi:carboxypeptidase family protein/Big-like domain-containing protein
METADRGLTAHEAPGTRRSAWPTINSVRWIVAIGVAALMAVAAWACGSSQSPTTATPAAPAPPTPTVTSMSVTGAAPIVGATSQLTATATFSNSSTQNVTTQAAWQSSDQSIATVSSGGLVTGKSAGGVDITATFQAVNGSTHLTLSQPVPVTFSINGTVTDGTSGGILPNINIQVSTGANAGKSARTDSTGQYTITGVSAGTMTLTASAVSYQTTDKTVTVTSSTRVDFVLPRTPSQPPPQPPTPSCSFGNGAFIKWTTDSTTCNCGSTISLQINGCTATSMSCTGSATVSVAPGSYSIRACAGSICTTAQTISIAANQTYESALSCKSSSSSNVLRCTPRDEP